MKMSYYTQQSVLDGEAFGYTKSLKYISNAINSFVYGNQQMKLYYNSPRCRVQLYYAPDPIEKTHFDHQYKIFMNQAETTLLEKSKSDYYLQHADEMWTANEVGKTAMINSGIPEDMIHIYEHAVDSNIFFTKEKDKADDVIRILHINSDSGRKRADLVEKAFDTLFKDSSSYQLTMHETYSLKNNNVDWNSHETLASGGEWVSSNKRIIRQHLSDTEIASLMRFHDILVYPSEGEGFGMIPLEALSSGMIVCSTSDWASYAKFLYQDAIDATLGYSNTDWGFTKSGMCWIPSLDSVMHSIKEAVDDFDNKRVFYLEQSKNVQEEYSWQNKTNEIMNDLVGRLGIECFYNAK